MSDDSDATGSGPGDPGRAERLNETQQERAGESGDDLARAVDRHREDFGLPAEPADGEDASTGD